MDDSSQIPPNSTDHDYVLYRVKPGDTLSGVLKRYHPQTDAAQLESLSSQVADDNPSITSPDRIFPGQLIKLRVPSRYSAPLRPFQRLHTVRSPNSKWAQDLQRNWDKSTSEQRTLMSAVLPAFMSASGTKLTMLDTTLATNSPLLAQMINNYESFKAGKKTKGQYDYQRKKLVDRFTKNLGPTNLILNGTQPPTEVLRISNLKGTTPTEPISKQVRKVKNIATIAKGGGVALSFISLGMTCQEIANTKRRDEQNEVLVESAGSLLGGLLYGIGTSIGLAFLATPVGWVTGLVIGGGGLATGYLLGQGAKTMYTATGREIDFMHEFGVDSVCQSSKPLAKRKTPILSGHTLSVL